jgi:hypothetical protein
MVEEARTAVLRVEVMVEERSAVHSRCNPCQSRTGPVSHTGL